MLNILLYFSTYIKYISLLWKIIYQKRFLVYKSYKLNMRQIIQAPEGNYEQFAQSDFERSLYNDGVYNESEDSMLEKAHKRKMLMRDWYSDKDLPIYDELHSVMRVDMAAEWDLSWMETYKGKVPSGWDSWIGVSDTFREAGKERVQLSDELIAAGLMHHHWQVVSIVLETQSLSFENLLLLKERISYERSFGEEIKESVLADYRDSLRIHPNAVDDLKGRVDVPTLLPNKEEIYNRQLRGANGLRMLGMELKQDLKSRLASNTDEA